MSSSLPPFRLALGDAGVAPLLAVVEDGIINLAIDWEGGRHPISIRPEAVPVDELPAVAELLGLAGSAPVALFRIATPSAGSESLAPVRGVATLPDAISSTLLDAIYHPSSQFPLVELGTVSHPSPPQLPVVRYLLARYDAELAARAAAIERLEIKGADFGWLNWDAWTKGTLTARPWAQMHDAERLLAIAEFREREETLIAAPMTPHFASFGERAADAEAAGESCTYCGAVGRELYRVAPSMSGDAALTPGAAAHDRVIRLMCAECRANNSGRQIDQGRRAALRKLRSAWGAGRLVSGSFSGDLHALSVIIGGKDGYFTIAERQAKELVDLLTFGEVIDLTAEKGVADQGVDALFFANRGLFTPSGRRYIAVEVKSTSSIDTLRNSQLPAVLTTTRNVAAKALTGSATRLSAKNAPAEIQEELKEEGAGKRWYRYYVTKHAYDELCQRADRANEDGTALSTDVADARDRLTRYFVAPEGVDPGEHARWAAGTLARTVESVLIARFTSLDGDSDRDEGESISASGALDAARDDAAALFDSYLFFDLFGRPVPGFIGTTIAGIDMGPVETLVDTVVRLLTRLRVRVHAQGHPEHYPREAIARLEADAA